MNPEELFRMLLFIVKMSPKEELIDDTIESLEQLKMFPDNQDIKSKCINSLNKIILKLLHDGETLEEMLAHAKKTGDVITLSQQLKNASQN